MTLTLAGTRCQLLPQRAAWLPAERCLLVADLHLGRSATFRARGIPVPEGENRDDLARLAALVATTGARRLVIAGDLVHAAAGLGPGLVAALGDWLDACPAEVVLTEGNHDLRARLRGRGLPLGIVREYWIGPLTVVHDPLDLPAGQPGVTGHLHPSVRLQETPRKSLRVPCFLLRGEMLTLPGFGTFTGTNPVQRERHDRLFLPVGGAVRELPAVR
jgi:DNA ligase-associated metallophosphoesterase